MAVRQYTEEEHNVITQSWAELFAVPEDMCFIYKRYKFEGVTFVHFIPPENVAAVREWKTREDDIFISTYPKSVMYGSWFDHVEKYWEHRNQGNVFFTSYEEMKKDLRSVVKPLSKFLGHELDEDALDRVEEKSSVKAMKKTYDDIEKNVPGGVTLVKAMGKNSYIQKGVTGSWKEAFTVAENELFDQVCKEKMASWDINVFFE
ncbi:Sulfotransferase family cytosolic 1B member 1 [Holothuria leucospilota]|uniref:Sulfotransferase family cytosolic 1B member 1 n=1 Tax=Holothuria leucospilota TaxID=206669 RepID=A0A9Q1HBP6_HOLLE|nr:Sulfotransferase family cytosolic 1B member 1 [Holothuria leucospilota]